MFTFDIRRAGRQICLALQLMAMSPERKKQQSIVQPRTTTTTGANLLDSKMLGSLNLNYCYSCGFRIWTACPCDCRLKIQKKSEWCNFAWDNQRPSSPSLSRCNSYKPVLENLMPFRKKHTTISSAERIFNRTHCVPNIMNNTLF